MPCNDALTLLNELTLEGVIFNLVLNSFREFDCFISRGKLFHNTAPLELKLRLQ